LDNLNCVVVEQAIEKPDTLLKYITEKLTYIPAKIIIYEDRPNYFIERKKELEETL
jgi:hypothetical protein